MNRKPDGGAYIRKGISKAGALLVGLVSLHYGRFACIRVPHATKPAFIHGIHAFKRSAFKRGIAVSGALNGEMRHSA